MNFRFVYVRLEEILYVGINVRVDLFRESIDCGESGTIHESRVAKNSSRFGGLNEHRTFLSTASWGTASG